ncbi:MAG TPA: hypothetical protein PKN32_09620 [Bacteroidales bacterium]|nr:hypothetical protein [Bacteroidales bacterium]
MKKTFILFAITFLAVIFACNKLNAQEESNYETLLSRDDGFSHGAYVGMDFGYTEVANRSSFLTGVTIAWVIDHTIELGIAGKGFVTNPLPDLLLENNNYMYAGGYGGLHCAVNILGKKPINVSIPIILGAGEISYIRSQYTGYYDNFYPESHYLYFVVEPGIELQLNMTKFFRLSAGVSYRYTSDIYLLYSNIDAQPIASPSILRGLNAGIKIKFGRF